MARYRDNNKWRSGEEACGLKGILCGEGVEWSHDRQYVWKRPLDYVRGADSSPGGEAQQRRSSASLPLVLAAVPPDFGKANLDEFFEVTGAKVG